MHERTVVLGVSGSIAAYKAVDLASKLTQAGVTVRVVMTEAATKLVGPATFRAITGWPVSTDMFELTNPFSIEHISLSEAADLVLVAPATANVLAKFANGLSDDLLSCTILATRAPILIAPAMHTAMWENAATQANVEQLRARGVAFVGPAVGRLASGGFGEGRFAPVADVLGEALRLLGAKGDLAGRKIVVSAAGTREPIDPVRFLGNRSTGRMGFAIAEAARDRGADVTLVTGPTGLTLPTGMTLVNVQTAAEMHDAIETANANADVLIMAAAVADFAPATRALEKLKKTDDQLLLAPTSQERADAKLKKRDNEFLLPLSRTADILATVEGPKVRIGFAAETENLLENAAKKLAEKKLDLIVANDVSEEGSGFASNDNRCTILDAAGGREDLPLQSKREVAERLLDRVADLLADSS